MPLSTLRLAPSKLSTSPQTSSAEELSRWFGVEFSVWDSTLGRPLSGPANVAVGICSAPGVLASIYQTEEAGVLADEDPLLVLGVPLAGIDETETIAVGAVPLRDLEESDSRVALAELLGIDPNEVDPWFQSRMKWTPAVALRFSMAFLATKRAETQVRHLENRLEDSVARLTSSYEEISLLHRLTQHLQLSSTDEELGDKAAQWLLDYLPARGAALLLLPVDGAEQATYQARRESVLVTQGDVSFDCQTMQEYVSKLDFSFSSSPHLINFARSAVRTPLPGTRQLVVAQIGDRQHLFGYLALINHVGDRPFGSNETTMMGSVAAILGIHCGNYELYRQHGEFLASVVRALTSAIDAKDPYTCGHSDRVARIAVRLARELDCDPDHLQTLYMAGLLHDVGKIGVNDAVLQKPGSLTDEEFKHIQQHPQLGYNILADIRQLSQVLPIVLHHHEQWDGRGYPHGLAERQIPLLARVAAVADAFDAMTSKRPYRDGMPIERVEQIMRNGSGTQWDPTVIDAYFRCREDIHQIISNERENLSLDINRWI